MILWCAGVYQHPSTFRSVILQPVGVDKTTIWQIKENFPSFDMVHGRLICPIRLHGKTKWNPLPFFPLVGCFPTTSQRQIHPLSFETLQVEPMELLIFKTHGTKCTT